MLVLVVGPRPYFGLFIDLFDGPGIRRARRATIVLTISLYPEQTPGLGCRQHLAFQSARFLASALGGGQVCKQQALPWTLTGARWGLLYVWGAQRHQTRNLVT